MGIRLYPNTKTVQSLETLAGVPMGTAARLEAIKTRHKTEMEQAPQQDHYDLGYKHWCEINDDQALGAYSGFLLFGWGKFDPAGIALGCAGGLDNPALIRILFDANGINANIELCEGIHWS